jgi:hypothetical protein
MKVNNKKLNYSLNENNKMSDYSRAALGHVAKLGDLYDARTDNFIKMSIFNQKIPESALDIKDNHFTDFKITHSDSYSKKCSLLDVKAELQVICEI